MTTASLDLTSGGAIFARLQRLGVDVVFANSGTDFPPIIEGLAEAEAHDVPLPKAVLVPHEIVAMGMAHGYWLASGRSQAVMLHTNVGLANGVIGAINAAADHVPMILMSGRTPATEQGRFGSRTTPIGWGQEMHDQAALVRESVKWEYELRFPEQVGEALDRAHAIANSTPKGLAYLSLPREILCEPCPDEVVSAGVSMTAAEVVADGTSIERIADLIAGAERPLIIAQGGAGTRDGYEALGRLADTWSVPICHYWALTNGVDAGHPCCVGEEPGPWLADADVVLVLDGLAPWMPDKHELPADATVVHLGPDPLSSRFPMRSFRCDLAVASELGPALIRLEQALAGRRAGRDLTARQERIDAHVADHRAALRSVEDAGAGTRMSRAFAARVVGEAVAGRSATVLSELGAPMGHLRPSGYDAWRLAPHAGGLGWGLPCAMGMKMADPDRLVVATVGDGSYMFSNPVACHQTAEAHGLAVLTVVLNNQRYEAVRRSVIDMYPTGYAAKADEVPLTQLPSPDYAAVAAACGVAAARVDHPDELAAALGRAIDTVTIDRRQALVEVAIE